MVGALIRTYCHCLLNTHTDTHTEARHVHVLTIPLLFYLFFLFLQLYCRDTDTPSASLPLMSDCKNLRGHRVKKAEGAFACQRVNLPFLRGQFADACLCVCARKLLVLTCSVCADTFVVCCCVKVCVSLHSCVHL